MEIALDIALRGEISTEGFGRLAGEFLGEEIGELVVFEFGNGFGENLLVGLVSQIGDETALFGPQEIAGAADVEILHSDVDAAAEVGKTLDGLEAAATVVGQGTEGRRHEIAEGFLTTATHTTAHLVQVGKSEVLGVVDEDGIGVRHVDAVFDDGGGEEDVKLVIDKIEDDFLKFGGFHLSVADHDACIGHVFANEVLDVGELRDAVRNDIDLAVATELEIDGVGDDLMTEGVNFGANGVTIGRRGVDDAEIARAHQRELEGARNGRGGHGERVDIDFHLAQAFFDGHTKFLLFVDDEQAEIFEFNGFPDEFVRADEDVDVSLGEIFEQGFGLRRGAGSGEVVDTDGEVLQPLGEGLVMLERQDGGGHHDGDLLAVGGGFEGGANGDFGFAEADIATDQTIHGARLLHVGFHLTRDAQLVGRVLIGEGGLELVLQETVGRESKTAFGTTTAVEEDEIAGNVFEFLLGAIFESLPCAGSQVRKTRRRTFFSLVLRDFVERVDRHENGVVVLILDLNDFLHRAVAAGNAHETDKLPHPVIDVNHVVAGFKLADFLEGERHFCVPGVVGTQIVFVETVEDLVIGVERGTDRRVAEAFVQSEVDGGEKCALGLLAGGLHQLAEDVTQPLLLFLAVGQDESALTVGEIFDKGVQNLLKVLVEQGLGLGVKDDSRHLLAAGGRLCAGTAHPLPENAPFQLRL